jgi:S1-C subfamily serine protease
MHTRWGTEEEMGIRLDFSGFSVHLRRVLKLLFQLGCGMALAVTALGADPEKSVIQITTFSQQPDWDAPWRFDPVRRASGTGFVIRGKRIMTNAHVVSWAKEVMIRRYQDPRPYLAKVAFIGHDCDLALLEVENDRFFDGMTALEIGELPKVRSAVVTYGYPAGGEQISYTRGVVSRIEMQPYVHVRNRSFLAVQTDAAINPGNSGGPVIQDDRVVGVAFQNQPGLENSGFFIPPPVIQHFLKDIENGKYDGFPQAGVRMVPLHNPAYRQYLQMPDNDLGARIDYIYPVPTSAQLLQLDDVLLQVGPYPVGSDGTILYQGNRVYAAAAFNEPQNGESIPLKLWRHGQATNVSLPLFVNRDDRTEGNQYELPRYYVYGGLVFTPLSLDYFRTIGQNTSDPASANLFYELFYRRQEQPSKWRSEAIVLATVLSHPVNANLAVRGRVLVDKINGVRIEKLEDVVRAFGTGTKAQHLIEFAAEGHIEGMDRAEADRANAEILKTYGLTQDRRL